MSLPVLNSMQINLYPLTYYLWLLFSSDSSLIPPYYLHKKLLYVTNGLHDFKEKELIKQKNRLDYHMSLSMVVVYLISQIMLSIPATCFSFHLLFSTASFPNYGSFLMGVNQLKYFYVFSIYLNWWSHFSEDNSFSKMNLPLSDIQITIVFILIYFHK